MQYPSLDHWLNHHTGFIYEPFNLLYALACLAENAASLEARTRIKSELTQEKLENIVLFLEQEALRLCPSMLEVLEVAFFAQKGLERMEPAHFFLKPLGGCLQNIFQNLASDPEAWRVRKLAQNQQHEPWQSLQQAPLAPVDEEGFCSWFEGKLGEKDSVYFQELVSQPGLAQGLYRRLLQLNLAEIYGLRCNPAWSMALSTNPLVPSAPRPLLSFPLPHLGETARIVVELLEKGTLWHLPKQPPDQKSDTTILWEDSITGPIRTKLHLEEASIEQDAEQAIDALSWVQDNPAHLRTGGIVMGVITSFQSGLFYGFLKKASEADSNAPLYATLALKARLLLGQSVHALKEDSLFEALDQADDACWPLRAATLWIPEENWRLLASDGLAPIGAWGRFREQVEEFSSHVLPSSLSSRPSEGREPRDPPPIPRHSKTPALHRIPWPRLSHAAYAEDIRQEAWIEVPILVTWNKKGHRLWLRLSRAKEPWFGEGEGAVKLWQEAYDAIVRAWRTAGQLCPGGIPPTSFEQFSVLFYREPKARTPIEAIDRSSLALSTALAFLGLWSGKQGRWEIYATGDLTEDGKVGAVSGIKAKARITKSPFLVPSQQASDAENLTPVKTLLEAARKTEILKPDAQQITLVGSWEFEDEPALQDELASCIRVVQQQRGLKKQAGLGHSHGDQWRVLCDKMLFFADKLDASGKSTYKEKAAEGRIWAGVAAGFAGNYDRLEKLLLKAEDQIASLSEQAQKPLQIWLKILKLNRAIVNDGWTEGEKFALELASTEFPDLDLMGRAFGTAGRFWFHRTDKRDTQKAVELLFKSLDKWKEKNPDEVPRSLCYLASAYRLQGQLDKAEQALKEAERLLKKMETKNKVFTFLTRFFWQYQQARLLLAQKHYAQALQEAEEMLDECILWGIHLRLGILRVMAQAAVHCAPERVAAIREQAQKIYGSIEDRKPLHFRLLNEILSDTPPLPEEAF